MDSLRFLQGSAVSARRRNAFVVLYAGCGAALFATTWKLWTPQRVFPSVPLLSLRSSMPAAVEWISLGVVVLSLTVLLAASLVQRWRQTLGSAGASRSQNDGSFSRMTVVVNAALLALALATCLLFVGNQHRLQPWAYQLVATAIVLVALPARRAFVLLRCVVISIYFWSALAKLDFSFTDSIGQQFLAAAGGLVGAETARWSPAHQHIAALVFPLCELLIAAGLCLPLQRFTWLRRGVLTLAIVMHVALILVLSPLGLNQQPAVIVWNIWFILQALLLFGFPERADADDASALSKATLAQDLSGVLVELLIAMVILLPVLNLFGRFDHWLAWGLYAPRNSRATLYIQQTPSEHLPAELKHHLGAASNDGWRQLRLDQWSLEALSAPIYPQDRFQFAVADAVIREFDLQDGFQLIVESPADRWSGRRHKQTLRSLPELESHRRRYIVNAKSVWHDLPGNTEP